MGVHAGNVSNGNQAKELHMTHRLDGSSFRECQQWKSGRGAAHDSQAGWEFIQGMSAMEIRLRLTNWMGVQAACMSLEITSWMEVHAGNVSNGNQAETHSLHVQWKSH
jgi:hypothetical protein